MIKLILGIATIVFALGFNIAFAGHIFGPHWSDRTVTVVDATKYPIELQQSIDAWNQSNTVQLTREPGDCRRQNGKIVVCSGSSWYLPLTAWTEYDTQHWRWQWGAERLHYKWVQIFVTENFAVEQYDWFRRIVFCHELGHALGLDENPNESPGCLAKGPTAIGTREYPDAHDFETLAAIYNHTD